MFVLLHICIALGSIGYTGLTFFWPSKRKLQIASGLIGATVASGTYLVIKSHSSLLSVCLMGLIYIGGMLAALIATQHKLSQALAD